MVCKDKGRIWGDTSTSQGTPKTDNKLPEARGEAWNILEALQETNLVNTLILDFTPPEFCYSIPVKRIHSGRLSFNREMGYPRGDRKGKEEEELTFLNVTHYFKVFPLLCYVI